MVRVLAAYGVSELGDGITAIALPLLAYGTTGSVVATGFIVVAGMLPEVLFGLHAGVLADRLDRRTTFILTNLGQGTVLLAVPLLPSLWLVAAAAFVARTLGTLAGPAAEAALPALAGERYQQLAAIRSGIRSLDQAVGPALGGVLVGVLGAKQAILVDAVTFFVAAALVYGVRGFDATAGLRRAERATSRIASELLEGLRHLRGNTVAFGMILYSSVGLFALPFALLGAIPYITDTLGRSPTEYGLAVASFAVGSLLGLGIAGGFSYARRRRLWLLGAGLGYGLCGLGLGLAPPYWLFCLLKFLWGVSYGPEQILKEVLIAESAPDAMRGRVYGVLGLALSGATLLGYLAAGPAIERFGAPPMMAAAGTVFIVSSIIAFGFGPLARAVAATDAPAK